MGIFRIVPLRLSSINHAFGALSEVTTNYEHYYYFKCIDMLLAQLSKSYCLIYMDLSNSLFLGRAQSILTFMAITSSALLNSLHFTLRQA